jgi:hypothetical protein
MELTDNIWKTLEGGYKIPFDASIPLRQLELTNDTEKIKKIWDELWNELHHQGDVGLASYLSLPQMVRIGKLNELYDWNLLGLCCVIEQQRHLGNNPTLPAEFSDYYNKGLADLKHFVLNNLNKKLDNTTYTLSLATLATCNGQIELGKAIMELEDKDILDELLKQF